MKNMNKGKMYFSVIISIILVISLLPISAYAGGRDKLELTQQITINEFDALKETASENVAELRREGYSPKEINAIKNFDEEYREYVKSLNEREDAVLAEWGYTAEEIDLIRNFNGTESEMRALSANVTVSITPSAFEYDKTKKEEERYTVGKLLFSWQWDKIPFSTSTDIVGIAMNGWVTTGDSCVVNYYNMTTGKLSRVTPADKVKAKNGNKELNGVGYKFAEAVNANNEYAKHGSGWITLKTDVHALKDCYYSISYGHTQLNLSVNFSVGWSGIEPVVNFNSGVKTLATASGMIVPTVIR